MKINDNTQLINQSLDSEILKSASNNSVGSLQPLKTSKQELTAAVKESVIYHGSAESQPPASSQKIELYRYYLDDELLKKESVNNLSEKLHHIEKVMGPVYNDFKQQLDQTFPQLSHKEFGITVQSDGTLTILNNKYQLNDQEQKTIEQFINNFDGSNKLSKLALQFAESSVDYVEAERGTNNASKHVGKFDLTIENFSEAFDFSAMLTMSKLSRGANWELEHQIYASNLEEKYRYGTMEKLVDGD